MNEDKLFDADGAFDVETDDGAIVRVSKIQNGQGFLLVDETETKYLTSPITNTVTKLTESDTPPEAVELLIDDYVPDGKWDNAPLATVPDDAAQDEREEDDEETPTAGPDPYGP